MYNRYKKQNGGLSTDSAQYTSLSSEQRQSLAALQAEKTPAALWAALDQFEGETFHTAKGLAFTYAIRGGELFVSRKEKSITRATVELAFQKALELGSQASGPKKLGCFGASYLYPVFLRLGVIVLDGNDDFEEIRLDI